MQMFQRKDNHEVVVEAVKLDESNLTEAADWANGSVVDAESIEVTTSRGLERAVVGQYVSLYDTIFSVVPGDIFERIFEPVTEGV